MEAPATQSIETSTNNFQVEEDEQDKAVDECVCFQDMEHKTCKLPFVRLIYILFLSHLVFCQLDYKYYDSTCPNLARIVRYGVWSAITNDTRMAASLVRLHFHDCFVNVMNLSSIFM
ncbi:hypothetical protein POUND7_014102 [Theobroma cacao]